MTSDNKPTFEPFLTVSLVYVTERWSNTPVSKVALTSNGPGFTAVHVHDGPSARKLAAELNRLADVIDPPPQAAAIPDKEAVKAAFIKHKKAGKKMQEKLRRSNKR